ncbi:hypothetical protein BGX24_012218 [Mortierella sp. AD032]|nr:hypothetical protein BGX24_012218 [Mortierella sp. AD032]
MAPLSQPELSPLPPLIQQSQGPDDLVFRPVNTNSAIAHTPQLDCTTTLNREFRDTPIPETPGLHELNFEDHTDWGLGIYEGLPFSYFGEGAAAAAASVEDCSSTLTFTVYSANSSPQGSDHYYAEDLEWFVLEPAATVSPAESSVSTIPAAIKTVTKRKQLDPVPGPARADKKTKSGHNLLPTVASSRVKEVENTLAQDTGAVAATLPGRIAVPAIASKRKSTEDIAATVVVNKRPRPLSVVAPLHSELTTTSYSSSISSLSSSGTQGIHQALGQQPIHIDLASSTTRQLMAPTAEDGNKKAKAEAKHYTEFTRKVALLRHYQRSKNCTTPPAVGGRMIKKRASQR